MTLDEARAHIGNKVVYRHAGVPEEGVVTSVNDHYVFVRYGGNVGSQATRADDLEPIASSAPRSCRDCGCTDDDCTGCIERTGQPCRWVSGDLCSACAPTAVA